MRVNGVRKASPNLRQGMKILIIIIIILLFLIQHVVRFPIIQFVHICAASLTSRQIVHCREVMALWRMLLQTDTPPILGASLYWLPPFHADIHII